LVITTGSGATLSGGANNDGTIFEIVNTNPDCPPVGLGHDFLHRRGEVVVLSLDPGTRKGSPSNIGGDRHSLSESDILLDHETTEATFQFDVEPHLNPPQMVPTAGGAPCCSRSTTEYPS
jgi:hypothetical protein